MTDSATDARQQQLKTWLQHTFDHQPFRLSSLAGDASARRYHRIQLLQSEAITERYIVMDSADEQDAIQQFITVAKLMAPAVNVPTLIAQDLDKGFLVLQDFGAVEFAHLLVDATPEQVNKYYQLAMQSLIDLQKVSVDTAKREYQLPDYDAAMLGREMDLFSDWFIPYIDVPLDATLWHTIKTALTDAIFIQPQVVVHRDYHSRNLMQDQSDHPKLTGDKASLGIIDFQDAVIGAYSYDLVSLVRDAYVDWPEPQVSAWIHDFWQMQLQAGLPVAPSAERFERDVNVMGVQRHLKVLGIFIRLSQRDGKDRYLADIPKVMRDLLFELEWLGAHGDDAIKQAILPFSIWMIQTVLPAYQSKFS